MKRMWMLLVVAATVLNACSAPKPPPNRSRVASEPAFTLQVPPGMAGAYPENYKAVMAAWVSNTFFDPFSLRNAEITRPVEAKAERFGWLVCFSANARNRYGAYAGQQTYAVLINGGVVVDAFPKTTPTAGMPASYQRLAATHDSLQKTLALDLCAQAVQSGKVRFEPY